METPEINQEKIESHLDKLKKKPLLTIITFLMSLGSIGIGGYLGSIWDDSINKSVIKSEVIKSKVHEWVDERIQEKMNDPLTYLEVLASDAVSNYAQDKAYEVRESIREEMLKQDSSKVDFIEVLGKAMGIRNEDVIPTFSKMMKEYISGRLGTRRITAEF